MQLTIEVVCYNITSVLNAINSGASRIELCDSPGDGGTTPSSGMIELVKEKSPIPVFVMIRPRGGDFLYSEEEYEVMKRDVVVAKKLNADGVVFGILNADGTMDTERNKKLIELAKPMKATCHRAFDMTNDPYKALEDCIAAGFDRILSSGQQASVVQGKELLSALVQKAGDRIIIMPGAGVNEENVAELVASTKAKEIHVSGRAFVDSPMQFRNPDVSMGDDPKEYKRLIADPERLWNIRRQAEGK